MDRSLWGHAALAAVASVAAYIAWVEPVQSTERDSVVMLPGSADRLTEVTWDEETATVSVKREGQGTVITVKQKRKWDVPDSSQIADPMKAAAAAAHAAAVKAGPDPQTDPEAARPKMFPGTAKAMEVFETLAPLRAARSLGKPDEQKRKALGLDPGAGTLKLAFGSEVRTVTIGNATFGSGSLYAQPEGGEVYLVSSSVVSGLKHGANSLVERYIVGTPREKIARVVVNVGDKGREFVQRDAEDRSKAFFADPAEPDQKLEKGAEWLDRIIRLRLVEFVDQKPEGQPAIVAEIWGDKELLDEVKIYRSGDKDAVATSKRFGRSVSVARVTVDSIVEQFDGILAEGKAAQ